MSAPLLKGRVSVRRPRTRCIGYVRDLGRRGPPPQEQIRALRSVGCHPDNIHKDGVHGRHALDLALIDARDGDVFIIANILCLGSLANTARVLADLQSRNVAFRALKEKFDSRAWQREDPVGVLVRIADFKRRMASQRIRIGLRRARKQGRIGGRRPVLSAEKRAAAEELIARGKHTMAQIAARVGVSRRTLYNGGLTITKKLPPGDSGELR